jgi:stage II sporulation protein D
VRSVALIGLIVVACSARLEGVPLPPVTRATTHAEYDAGDRVIRVALASAATVRVSATSEWRLYGADGRSPIGQGSSDAPWSIERQEGGRRLRAIRRDGVHTTWQDGPIILRAAGRGGLLSLGARRYRGDLAVYAADSGLLVVNRLRLDDYLKGVVPIEIGTGAAADSAAAQAQAVAARSFAFIHLGGDSTRPFDISSSASDQSYGGADVETPVGSMAVESTRRLVLKYAGRVVSAPYHSTCGGTTAEAAEVWRSTGEPYLRRVSDRIPGTDRYYCDISPRFHWTRAFDAHALNAVIARYLSAYAAVPGANAGAVRAVSIDNLTPSGRVGVLLISTDRGNFPVRGNDVRFVLRALGGEILNSTYFSIDMATDRQGMLSSLTLHGAGYGHGVGMCQWGAIGRARAGQDFRTILRTYYPGTTVGTAE